MVIHQALIILNKLEEFLKEYYVILTYGVEIMAAVAGILFLGKYKHSAVKYFIYFLIYVVFVELIGSYPRYLIKYDFLHDLKVVINDTVFVRNYWWFTIFWIIGSMLFYSFYYHKILEGRFFKKILKFGIVLALLMSLIVIFSDIEMFFNGRHFIINLLNAIIVLLCVLFYFIEMLNSDKILTFHKSFNFYVSATIFIWWLVTTPLSFYEKYFNMEDNDFILLKYKILLFSNLFMYTSFTFALIWCRPQND